MVRCSLPGRPSAMRALLALLMVFTALPTALLVARIALDSCVHERHARGLAARLAVVEHPVGTGLLESTWVVGNLYGQGESNCDYVAVAVRSGLVSSADVERYSEAGADVYVPGSGGYQSPTGGPPLPPLPVSMGHPEERYLVAISDDSQDAGWDLRCLD